MHTKIALAALAFSGTLFAQSDAPAITDSGEVRLQDALALIEDESPAADRRMPLLVRNIEATLQLRAKDPDYLVLLAKAYTRMSPAFGMHRGTQLADEALKVNPKHIDALLFKSEQATRSNCIQCAKDLLEEAKMAGAPAARLHVVQATIHMMESMNVRQNPGGAAYENESKNPWQLVIEESEKAVALETNPARKARIYGWIFAMQRQLGDGMKARAAAEAAIAANPQGRTFIEQYAGFLLHEGEIDRAAELAGKLAYYDGHPQAEETIAMALYLKWAKAWERDPSAKRTKDLLQVARQTHKDIAGLVHTASSSEATAPVARVLILSKEFDMRAGDYRDQDGDTTLGNIILHLVDQAMARRYSGSGPRPTEELTKLMTLLINSGANPNAWVSRGKEPMLATAARSGQTDTVNALLNAGARVNDRGATGTTALIAAAQSEDKDAAHLIGKLLLAKGADVDASDQYKQTALVAAARSGNAALVDILLARGASTRQQDENDYGPLEYAAQSGDLPTVRSLLAANLTVRDIVNGCGRTNAIRIAEGSGHKEVAELLRRHVKEGI